MCEEKDSEEPTQDEIIKQLGLLWKKLEELEQKGKQDIETLEEQLEELEEYMKKSSSAITHNQNFLGQKLNDLSEQLKKL